LEKRFTRKKNLALSIPTDSQRALVALLAATSVKNRLRDRCILVQEPGMKLKLLHTGGFWSRRHRPAQGRGTGSL